MIDTSWNTKHLPSFKTIQLLNSTYIAVASFQDHLTVELNLWLILIQIVSIYLLPRPLNYWNPHMIDIFKCLAFAFFSRPFSCLNTFELTTLFDHLIYLKGILGSSVEQFLVFYFKKYTFHSFMVEDLNFEKKNLKNSNNTWRIKKHKKPLWQQKGKKAKNSHAFNNTFIDTWNMFYCD